MPEISRLFLKQRQSLPLSIKIKFTLKRIKEFYEFNKGNVYVSFSGGKDSLVLLHLVRSIYPDVPAVFVNTGLEYPEIVEFVKTIPNVTWLKPKKSFKQVLDDHGYPAVSKKVARMINDLQNPTKRNVASRHLYLHGTPPNSMYKLPQKYKCLINCGYKISHKCCDVMKKNPIRIYNKETGNKAFIGTMASDSRMRMQSYLKTGCNSFEGSIQSIPLGFWLEKDVWSYLKKYKIPYSKIYDMGEDRTGCMFCMFGITMEKENRFKRMKISHPKLYDYCINKLDCGKIMDVLDIDYK